MSEVECFTALCLELTLTGVIDRSAEATARARVNARVPMPRSTKASVPERSNNAAATIRLTEFMSLARCVYEQVLEAGGVKSLVP